MKFCPRQAGFTLFEMSIVLVVIGLIAGSIVEGKSLIRAAQLRTVEKDYRRYVAAFNTFEAKYRALPGDMPNADQFWTLANSDPQTCRNTISTGPTTCNGNGSGTIDYSIDGYVTGSEMYHAWKQLQLAGLIEGQYTGHDASGSVHDVNTAKANTNIPGSGIDNAGFAVAYEGFVADNSDTWQWPGSYGHQMQYKFWNGTSYQEGGPVINPAEMKNLDAKIDDGLPATGKIVSNKPGAAGWLCTTTSDPTTAAYNLTVADNACIIDFITGF